MLWARRAATFNARHNLLESVSDLRLDSQTTIRDVLTKDDLDVFNGIIRKHYQVGSDSSDITYTVIMEIKLNDVYSYMKEKGIYYK